MRVAMIWVAGAMAAALASAEPVNGEVLVNRPFILQGGVNDGRCSPCYIAGEEPMFRGWAFIDPATAWKLRNATLWMGIPTNDDGFYVPLQNFSLSIWDRSTSAEILRADFAFADANKTLILEADYGFDYRLELSLPDWRLAPGSYLLSYFGDGTTAWLTEYEDLATGFTGYQTEGTTSPLDRILPPDAGNPRNWFFVLRGDAAAVPEPATVGFLGLGMILLRRRFG